MDNRGIHGKGMLGASVLAAPLIFVMEYISSRSLSQSLFAAVVGTIGAFLSLQFYRWVWPDKSEDHDNDQNAADGK